MAVYLRLREWAERNDRGPFAPGVLDRLSHQPLADPAPPQPSWHFGVVDNNLPLAHPAVRHFGFSAVDDDAVTSFRCAIFPLDRTVELGRGLLRRRVWRTDPARLARPTFQEITVPSAQLGSSFVGRDEKRHQLRLGIGRRLHCSIGQNELRHFLVPERRIGPDRRRPVTVRCRIGIGVDGGIIDSATARPETGRGHFPVVSFLRHIVRQRRNAPGVEGGTSSREARNCKIKTPPEEVNRTGLAEKGGPETIEDSVDSRQGMMEALNGVAVIGPVAMILGEGYRIGYLVRLSVERRRATEL